MSSYEEILLTVKRAWADVPAASSADLAPIAFSSGEESAKAFIGVRPVEVDIKAAEFLSATPLFELAPRVVAAYFGTYLIFLLNDYGVQKAVGFSTEVLNRAHVLTFLTRPNFWTNFVKPHFDAKRIDALGAVVAFVLENKDDFLLSDEEVDQLKRLSRSIRRNQDTRRGESLV